MLDICLGSLKAKDDSYDLSPFILLAPPYVFLVPHFDNMMSVNGCTL